MEEQGRQNAVFEWEEGYRRLQAARSDPARHRPLGSAVLAGEDELRKRLGSRFTVTELAGLYRESGDLAAATSGWRRCRRATDLSDLSAAVDAAFYLYMREASDFAGGRPTRARQRLALVLASGSSGSSSLAAGGRPPARRIVIASASTVTVTARWPAQCSEYTGLSTTAGSSHRP